MEKYKITSNRLSTVNFILLIIIFTAVIVLIGQVRDLQRTCNIIKADCFDLVSGTMTGKIGQPVGQEYQINKGK